MPLVRAFLVVIPLAMAFSVVIRVAVNVSLWNFLYSTKKDNSDQ